MSRNPLTAIWDKYGAELSIGLLLLGIYLFRGIFRGIGSAVDTAGSVVAGATASMQQSAILTIQDA